MSKETKVYTAREIGGAVNNAVLLASRPESFVILESRMRRLSEYTAALIAPCKEHVSRGLLEPEELVLVLASAALLAQAEAYTGGDKLPMSSVAKSVAGRKG